MKRRLLIALATIALIVGSLSQTLFAPKTTKAAVNVGPGGGTPGASSNFFTCRDASPRSAFRPDAFVFHNVCQTKNIPDTSYLAGRARWAILAGKQMVQHRRGNREQCTMDDANHKQACGDVPSPEPQQVMEQEVGAESAVRTLHLNSTGLRRMLGTLEADLLEAVWRLTPPAKGTERGWTTIAAVCGHLGAGYHYKTVQTVMNRLVDKRLLLRQQRQRAFEYRAALTQDELVAQVTRNLVNGLVRDFGDVAIAQLVQTLHEVGPDHLALLEKLAGASPTSSPLTLQANADDAHSQTGAEHTASAATTIGASQQWPSSKQR
jgi:predicted transcriptional regulator